MKAWLYASVSLNLALFAAMGYLVTRESPAPVTVYEKAPQAKSTPKAAVTPKPFHWSQIESEDFPVYVANLRAIGCPEATIRDIVAAELKEIYDDKRRGLARDNVSGPERRTAEAQCERLSEEERAVMTRVLGAGFEKSEKAAGTLDGPGPSIVRAPRAFYPVIFQGVAGVLAANNGSSVASPGHVPRAAAATGQPLFSSSQAAAVQQLQQQFVEEIGGLNQNPSDPAYLRRWQTAQQESDDSLRALIGWSAFSDYQLALAQKAQAEAQPAK